MVLKFFVWRHVGRLLAYLHGRLVHCVVIRVDVAQFFFDVTNKPSLCNSGERVLAFSDVHYQVLRKITVKPMMGTVLRHAVIRVHHTVSRVSRGVQEQNCLDRHVHGRENKRKIGGFSLRQAERERRKVAPKKG